MWLISPAMPRGVAGTQVHVKANSSGNSAILIDALVQGTSGVDARTSGGRDRDADDGVERNGNREKDTRDDEAVCLDKPLDSMHEHTAFSSTAIDPFLQRAAPSNERNVSENGWRGSTARDGTSARRMRAMLCRAAAHYTCGLPHRCSVWSRNGHGKPVADLPDRSAGVANPRSTE